MEKKISASEVIVRDVLRGLYESRYVPGQRLMEPDLIEYYGVSRTTIRDAIKQLSALGVLEAKHNRGVRIRLLKPNEARNILLIAEVLTGLAARQAARYIDTGDNRKVLEKNLDWVCRACTKGDKLEFGRARTHFHRGLARIGRNLELDRVLTTLQVHLVRNALVMDPDARAESYRAIGAAVLAGDEERAEAVSRQHVRQVIELLDLENSKSLDASSWSEEQDW